MNTHADDRLMIVDQRVRELVAEAAGPRRALIAADHATAWEPVREVAHVRSLPAPRATSAAVDDCGHSAAA